MSSKASLHQLLAIRTVDTQLEKLRELVPTLTWTASAGDGVTNACVNSLAGMLHAINQNERLVIWTDRVVCIHPFLRDLGIHINDEMWPDLLKKDATKWMHETAPKLLGTADISNRALMVSLLDQLFNDILFEYHGIPRGEALTEFDNIPKFLAERFQTVNEFLYDFGDTKNEKEKTKKKALFNGLQQSNAQSALLSLYMYLKKSGSYADAFFFEHISETLCSVVDGVLDFDDLFNQNDKDKRRCYAVTLLNNLCALKEQ